MKYVAIPLIAFVPVPDAGDFAHDLPDLFQGLESQALDALSGIGNADATAFVAGDFDTVLYDLPEGRELPERLTAVCPEVAGEREPVSPPADGLQQLARGESVHVATYLTMKGHIALEIHRHGTANGKSYYSYTGKHGAGSGHPAKHVADTVKIMIQTHRGIRLGNWNSSEMHAAGLPDPATR